LSHDNSGPQFTEEEHNDALNDSRPSLNGHGRPETTDPTSVGQNTTGGSNRSRLEEDGIGDPGEPERQSQESETDGILDTVDEEILAEVIQEEAPQIAHAVIRQQRQVRTQWRGPLPKPKDLAEYEAILPGLADRVVSMAEVALNGQVETEKCLANGDVNSIKRGQWMAFTLGGIAMLLAFTLIVASFFVDDLPWWAGTPFLSVPIFQFLAKLIRSVREPASNDAPPEADDT